MFDMPKEIVEYCINDVRTLTEACFKFRKLFLEECNVCSFTEATTIASACSLLYRLNFLKSNTIGIIPRGGYSGSSKHSKVALKWLIEEFEKRNVYIRHVANSKEVMVNGFKVDGCCEDTKQIFEFHGCYFHGYTCLTNRTKPLHYENPYDTLDSRLERTLMKAETLIQQRHEVVDMWEWNNGVRFRWAVELCI